jgi:hypothetical protein
MTKETEMAETSGTKSKATYGNQRKLNSRIFDRNGPSSKGIEVIMAVNCSKNPGNVSLPGYKM